MRIGTVFSKLSIPPVSFYFKIFFFYHGITNYLDTKVLINYNKWCIDEEYRKEIARELGVDTFIDKWNDVPTYSGGSSFDGFKFKNSAEQMNTLHRFDYFRDNLEYREILQNNPDLIRLSNDIFGCLSGAEFFG